MNSAVVLALAMTTLYAAARAQDAEPPPAPEAEPAPPEGRAAAPRQGILPVPDYTGDLLERRYLTGDWGGARTDLADTGIQFGANWHQHVQGVASGGRNRTTRYGGTLDYELSFDLMRMGVLPGALVKLRAESRYGDSINGHSGSILPVNTDMLFPLTDTLDDDVPFTLTTLSYLQMLSPTFGLIIGKMDTLDGDGNEFASGRGTSQFMNANFIFDSVLALRLPYSTLGGGLVWMPDEHILVTTTLMNTTDSSTTTGFSDIDDGLTWCTEARFQYRLGELPGGVNGGFLYSFDQDFARLDTRFVLRPGQGLVREAADDTWAAYFSGWQYLWVKDGPAAAAPVNVSDGMPDHQGLGLFWRAGFADGDTNPVEWSASGGIGGRGLIPTRDDDTFGIGYFYTSIQPSRLTGLAGLRDYAHGGEVFYSIAITPAARLTLDAQVLESPTSGGDAAVLLGLRLGLTF